jgi:hypothetical protein
MDRMFRLAALVALVPGCLVVPPQPRAAAPPPDPSAAQVARTESPSPPQHHHHRDDNDNDNDDNETPATEPDDTSFAWPPAGSVDPFGMGTQYTAADMRSIPTYERGRTYHKGDRVQIAGHGQPNTRVFKCLYLARCTEAAPAGNGWQDDGWFDARAPRYVKYTPPPALEPGENPFPRSGKPIDEDELHAAPGYDSTTTYPFGAMVQQGYVTNPHYVVYRCTQKACDHSPGTGNGWEAYGWYGRD